MNYVEQDENTFFVKKDPKKRYEDLSSILGAERQVAELERIRTYLSQIRNIISNKNKRKIEINKANKDVVYSLNEDLQYKRLLTIKDLVWDRENINNNNIETYQEHLKVIGQIKDLCINKHLIRDIRLHDQLQAYVGDETFLNKIINEFWSVNNFEYLQKEDVTRKELEKANTIIAKILDAINDLKYDTFIEPTIFEYLQTKDLKIDIESFRKEIEIIISLKASLSTHSAILENLKNRQAELVNLFSEHKRLVNLTDGECPTCGFGWPTSSQLLDEIKKTTDKIFETYNSTNKEFEQKKSSLHTEYLKVIQESASEELRKNKEKTVCLISSEEFSKANSRFNEYNREFNIFLGLFNKEGKDQIINIVNLRKIENVSVTKQAIVEIIKSNTPVLTLPQEKQSALLLSFNSYFDSQLDLIEKLEPVDIENKRKYIETQYYNAINKEIKSLEEDVIALEIEMQRVDELITMYDSKIKEYTSNIVNQVSIPFYIFTGKILQNHSLGTGLVLDLSVGGKDPSFKITPRASEHEVSYTLSSGQLSATVVSLMLVLNIVYNKSKLGTLLIDDPLQTLDEINSHSLIELLKHNFGEQQIVLSTHENEYSKLFRYKYSKFNLSHKNISLKNEVR
ncbi:ATP-binding cassette domain-containing protein [Bacteroides neonati]|uniref:ATP-binding cassette domain-containing protein n=1 Tax=Bacteroides neonati TaxID=1347393 RepID=UPI0004B3BC80|nr:ABC transporter ATP-binding protein [Bacteroides neonati]